MHFHNMGRCTRKVVSVGRADPQERTTINTPQSGTAFGVKSRFSSRVGSFDERKRDHLLLRIIGFAHATQMTAESCSSGPLITGHWRCRQKVVVLHHRLSDSRSDDRHCVELAPWHRRCSTAADDIRDRERRLTPRVHPRALWADSQAAVGQHLTISAWKSSYGSDLDRIAPLSERFPAAPRCCAAGSLLISLQNPKFSPESSWAYSNDCPVITGKAGRGRFCADGRYVCEQQRIWPG
jgi:hypothetical protein